MLILRPSRFMFSTSGMVIFFLISSCSKKNAPEGAWTDRQAVFLLWLRDIPFRPGSPSNPCGMSVSCVPIVQRDRLPEGSRRDRKRVYSKKRGPMLQKKSLDLAGPVFHGFQLHDHRGALEPPLLHVVEHFPDHLADRFHRVADLAAIFHLA